MPRDVAGDQDWQLVEDHGIPSDENVGQSKRGVYIKFQVSFHETRTTEMSRTCNCSSKARNDPQTRSNVLTASRPIASQKNSHLLSLPVEIRLSIYELLIQSLPTTKHGLQIHHQRPTDPPSVLAILLASRQIHHEAEPLFYTLHRLFISNRLSPSSLTFFARSLGPMRGHATTKLSVEVTTPESALSVLEQLHLLPNLRSLWLVRAYSVVFIRPSAWAVLAPNLVVKIEEYGALEEVKMITPGVENPTIEEAGRRERLREIDARIEKSVLRRVQSH